MMVDKIYDAFIDAYYEVRTVPVDQHNIFQQSLCEITGENISYEEAYNLAVGIAAEGCIVINKGD